MTQKPDTQPRKMPTQQRSKATVDAMIEATARILVSDGLDACSTNQIARVAGVSIGTLYQYFPSREALLAALVERELSADLEHVARALPEASRLPLRDALVMMLEHMLERCKDPSHLALHAIILPMVPELERAGLVRARMQDTMGAFLTLLDQRQGELRRSLRGDEEEQRSRRHAAGLIALLAIEQTINAAKTSHHELFDRADFGLNLGALGLGLLFEGD